MGDCRAPWNLAGPNLRGRESSALSTTRTLRGGTRLPGKPIAVLAPQLQSVSLALQGPFRPTSTHYQRACCCPEKGSRISKVTQPASDRSRFGIQNPGLPVQGYFHFSSLERCFGSLTLTEISHLSQNSRRFSRFAEASSTF